MNRHSTVLAALALTLAATVTRAADAPREAPIAPAPPLAGSIHATGGPLTEFGGPVVVRLSDVPAREPGSPAGAPRGHDQGQPSAPGQPGFAVGEPADDPGVVFGDRPHAPLAVGGEAPGDILRNFEGQTATGWIPPDPVLAVGPRYVVEVVNSGFTIFSKDGGLDRAYTELEDFFAPIYAVLPIPCNPTNCFAFDPRVLFTHAHGKYVLEALVRDDVNLRSYIVFAISQTDDPLGGWWQYFTLDTTSTTDAWTDYTGMAADPWGVYFTGNSFFWAGGFKHAIEISVRPDVFNGVWNGGWIFWNLTWNEPGEPQVFDLQPAVPSHGFAGDQATWFVNTFNSSGDKASIWKLTGDRGSAPTLVRTSATVSPYAAPGFAHQPPPGADDIEIFYAGAQNVAYSQRHVYLALNDAGAGITGFYVSKINVDTFTEARNITYYTGAEDYYYPNVMLYGSDSVNPLVAMAMSWSSESVYPSGAVKVFENFLVDNSGDFWGLAGGAGNYNVYFDGRNRWGDYMGIARDYGCDTLWAVTQFAPSLNVWSTQISALAGDQALPLPCRLIFDDGVERGTTANWSSTTP